MQTVHRPRGHVGSGSMCHCKVSGWQGCYDRYLEEHKPFTIGLVFESQMVKSVPFEKDDVPLDMLVSERHTYRR